MKLEWLDDPEDHDYPAALDYLTLLVHEDVAERVVGALRGATTVSRKAKDIVRASGIAVLPKSNAHVAKDIRKVEAGKALSPVLLVRLPGAPLVIADGYHRVCAAYHLDEDAEVPLRIAQP